MTGPQRKNLCQALEAAFPDPDELAQLVSFGLNKNLEAIVKPGPLVRGFSTWWSSARPKVGWSNC